MGIVDKHVAIKCTSSEIVNTAGTVSNIAHDKGFSARAEASQDIRDRGGEEEESFRKLEGDFL